MSNSQPQNPTRRQKYSLIIEVISERLRKSINYISRLPYRAFSCKSRRARKTQQEATDDCITTVGTSSASKTSFDRSLLTNNPDSSFSDLQVSQAITFAFLSNSEISKESTSSLSSLDKPVDFSVSSPSQIEATMYYETWVYTKRYIANARIQTNAVSSCLSYIPSIENYLQSKLNLLVSLVRQDRLKPESASEILSGLEGLIFGFVDYWGAKDEKEEKGGRAEKKGNNNYKSRTIVIHSMVKQTKSATLLRAFEVYGEILRSSVSIGGVGFGFVTFSDSESVENVMDIYQSGEIFINDCAVNVISLV